MTGPQTIQLMRAVAVCRVKFFPVDNLNEDMIMRHQPTFLWPETDKQTDLVLHVGDGVPDNVFTSNYLDELTPSSAGKYYPPVDKLHTLDSI